MIEWAYRGEMPRSVLWGGRAVPLLPVYGVGGLVAGSVPLSWSLPARAGAYAATLGGLEWMSCHAAWELLEKRPWDYDGACVDWQHAAYWTALGLAVGYADPRIFPTRNEPKL